MTHSVTVGDALLVLGSVLVLAPRIRRGILAGSVPSWLLLGGVGLLMAGLLAAFHGHVGQDLLPAIEFAGTLVVLPVVVMLAVASYRRLELVTEAWMIAASASAAVAVMDLKLGTQIGYHLTGIDFVTYTHRAPGLTLHPNSLGLVSAMAMPVAAVRASRRGLRSTFEMANVRNMVYVVLLAAGVLASGSRAALAAAAVAMVALPFFLPGRRRSIAVTGTGILIVVALSVLTFDSSLASRLGIVTGQRLSGQAAGTQVSNQYRIGAYATAIHDTLADPVVGKGFQAVLVAHDIYLQLLQAGGLVAFGAFLLFSGGVLSTAHRLTGAAEIPGSMASVAAGFGASFVAWLVAGLAENDLYNRYLYISVSLLLAARLIALQRPQPVATARRVRPPARESVAVPVSAGNLR